MSLPLMSCANERIKILFEEHNLTPEQIAADEGLDVEAIKFVLNRISPKYKAESEPEDITDGEHRVHMAALKQLGLTAECEGVKAKVLIYLNEEKKGRNELKAKAPQVGQLNVVQLAQCFAMAKKTKERVIKEITQENKEPIEV